MKFYQVNCREGNKPDYRQGRSILKRKPDIIFFEYAEKDGKSESEFNKFPPQKKPSGKVRQIVKDLRKAAKKYPYALSDILVWENIEKLWRSGKNVLLYNVDAPRAVRKEGDKNNWSAPRPLREIMREPAWWACIYIREKYMSRHIGEAIRQHRTKNKLAGVFLQSFHWQHVKFLLTKPTKKEIWNYYFGRFPKLNRKKLEGILKENYKFLFREFRKVEKW